MISPVSQSTNFALAAKLLDAAVMRQEAIATNIANAETPGYKRVDINPDFARELETRMGSGSTPAELRGLRLELKTDENARTMRKDGNTVEVEKEILEMNRNTVAYEFLTDYVSSSFKSLKFAITGRG
ncbi:flagellar basal body rod protein FlgB [Actomonas aquatica]|uniref:Flagellar basal body rod protein FlgB n=1 Tax=Actomonas aquatica TaxID=2866162 RepID=A0ABZ1CCH9_9BACT|nr:flagellar basal body rod protein FlgB [Opitutus sp. WL0086]WRQ89286.1 flagellar basal body rod protein FlgB [Opitutus sp. WL0086]